MKRLLKVFDFSVVQRWFIQALFIVFAVLLSIFTVTLILEKSLVKQALELEAEAFIESYRLDENFPLPRTRNLIGYLSLPGNPAQLPDEIADLYPGLYPEIAFEQRELPVPVFVKDFDGNRLYLVFEGANVDRLVGIFGLVPLSVLLIIIYTSSWIAYRITWRAVSPILSIAKNIRESDPDGPSLSLPMGRLSGETRELALALEDYAERIDNFVERERQFTADVSHELRTPMTIIDGAAQFLATENGLSLKGAERVQMIRRACSDVNEMITAFLMLAREEAEKTTLLIDVADVVESEMVKLHNVLDKDDLKLKVDIQQEMKTDTPKNVLEIILGNLCRNAYKYTEKARSVWR